MTEKQAEAQGLRFTGFYVRSYELEKAKDEAKALRGQGFRAVVCSVPDSIYSRGPRGVGYSVYVEDAYFVTKRIELLRQFTLSVDDLRAKLKQEYEAKCEELADKNYQALVEMQQLRAQIKNHKSNKRTK